MSVDEEFQAAKSVLSSTRSSFRLFAGNGAVWMRVQQMIEEHCDEMGLQPQVKEQLKGGVRIDVKISFD